MIKAHIIIPQEAGETLDLAALFYIHEAAKTVDDTDPPWCTVAGRDNFLKEKIVKDRDFFGLECVYATLNIFYTCEESDDFLVAYPTELYPLRFRGSRKIFSETNEDGTTEYLTAVIITASLADWFHYIYSYITYKGDNVSLLHKEICEHVYDVLKEKFPAVYELLEEYRENPK